MLILYLYYATKAGFNNFIIWFTFICLRNGQVDIFCGNVYSADDSTTNSKINGTYKDFYLPISKLHSILSVPNLLAHNNIFHNGRPIYE